MKKNKIILIITCVLAIIAFSFIYTTTKSTISKSLSNFAIEDTATVTKIFLTDKANNKVVLEKKSVGEWTVNNNFTANKDFVKLFLKTLLRIEIKSPVAKAARNNIVKRLSSIATKVEVYQQVYRIDFWGIKLLPHEKLVKTYYVGDCTQDNMGTYMLMEDSEEPFIMHIPGFRGFLNSRYSPYENDWRTHSVFALDIRNIKSVKLEYPAEPEKSFHIESIGKVEYKLSSLKLNMSIANYDTLRLLDYLSAFRDIKFEYLIPKTATNINKDSIISSTPYHILTVTDMSGKKSIVKTFHKKAPYDQEAIEGTPALYDKDRLYALFNDDKDFAIIQFFVFDNILRPLPYFLTSRNAKIPSDQ